MSAARPAPDKRSALAATLFGATLQQIISDAVFHADLHPGNIFITPGPGAGLLDSGAVGRLDVRAVERSLGQLLTRFRTGFRAGGSMKMFTALFALVRAHNFPVPA